mgnify:CR=1 FL=1|tara:strand:+ start:1397 stop:1774 length:378 start_codon:yes stop_codon:yes gene_type:complete
MINFEEVENIVLANLKDKSMLNKIRKVANYSFTIAKSECPEKVKDVLIAAYLHTLDINKVKDILQNNFQNLDIRKIIHAIKYHQEERITKDTLIGSIWDGYLLSENNKEIDIMSTAKGIELLMFN